MLWPGLVAHAVAIDVDLDVLQQLSDIKVASVLCPATADNPCDGGQLFPEGVLFLDGVHWFGENGVDEGAWPSSSYEVGVDKVGVESVRP